MRIARLTIITLLAAACGRSDAKPNGAVDRIVAIDTALARFRQGLAEPARLAGGAGSLTDLVAEFVAGLERADTATLAALILTREEFAYLYYPTIPEARPPYELDPGLMWFMLEGNSARGLTALLAERGGRSLRYVDLRCETDPRRHGPNVVHPGCFVRRIGDRGDTVAERLFGPVIERDGVFKFVSYANKL